MAVTMAEITKLRNLTSAGLMDCKKALAETNGDIDAAVEILRQKGKAVAAKREDRQASEGCVLAKNEGNFAAIVALCCETDFVAKNAGFVELTHRLLDFAIANRIQTLDELKAATIDGMTVADLITDETAKTGEKIELGQYECLEAPSTTSYNHLGNFGKISHVEAYWNRNGDWRREVPSPELERLINWRLYKASSKGLMTELGCHQIQVGTWAMQKLPDRVMGHGGITFWKDGREVHDNVHCIYSFNTGETLNYGSVISNKFYGLEEKILGNLGTVEPETGKYFFEQTAPAPAFLQMLNTWENKLFDEIPFAGTSWAPESANVNKGQYILGERPKTDGTSLNTDAFIEAVITGRQPARIAEEGYYASLLALWGFEAIEKGEVLDFPEEYKIDYAPYGTKLNKELHA